MRGVFEVIEDRQSVWVKTVISTIVNSTKAVSVVVVVVVHETVIKAHVNANRSPTATALKIETRSSANAEGPWEHIVS